MMNNEVGIIDSLSYKLRMFGVPIDGSTNVFFDNRAVCVNMTRPGSTLSKKHHSIAYHCARKAVAEGTIIVSKEYTSNKFDEPFTKTMAALKIEGLLDKFTY